MKNRLPHLRSFATLLTFVLLLFVACDTQPATSETANTTTETKDTLPPPPPPAPDNRPPLYLSGLYATSTAPSTDVRFVFDSDENTIWQTMSGAGPDEGIMLYFSEETYIKSVQVETLNGESYTAISSFSLYGNGSPLNDETATLKVPVGQRLLNMFIRFNTEQNLSKTKNTLPDNAYYDNIEVERFAKDKNIGLRQIIIEGEDGEFRVVPPRLIPGVVSASATLKPESFAYDPSLLFDARKEFVWVEGAEGNGIGASLNFEFASDVTIAGLHLWNGYQRSESHFKSNARLKVFRFGLEEGTAQEYRLEDQPGMQKVELQEPLRGRRFRLEIASAYKGWSYKDLAISEILFFDESNALFGINSQRPEANRRKILAQTQGTILENLVDSRIYNAYDSEEFPGYLTRSAILRSDGTFVLYSSEQGDVDYFETIADGNWEIIQADANSAQLNVFGKLLDFSQLEQYYAGEGEAELGRIFRDKISVQGNTIKGEKLVNAIEF